MKIIGRLLLFIILFPMWALCLVFDMAAYGRDYKRWVLYDTFFN